MLADLVETKLRSGLFPLILGGDHSIAIGSLSGILRVRPDTGVLWIDAHADLNTPDISESGNMHGMPIGLLMDGVSDPSRDPPIPGLEWMSGGPRLPPDSIVYVGLRDVDPEERKLIEKLGILAFTMHEIDRYGIGHVMDLALHHLLDRDGSRPLHMSYDIDAIDPLLAPATGTAVRGGLTYREAHYVAEAAARSGNLFSAEIVELNPTLSHEGGAAETIELGLQIITSMLGKSII
jgi:arginase